jgi:hypothetical protein
MEQNIDHKIEFKNKLINIYNSNKIKIYLIACITVLSVISLFIFKEINEKKNNLMSEKYIMAGLKINSGKKKEGANLLEEIILSKNKFYSILSLNKIIEENLESNEKKILNYFKIVENVNKSKEQNDIIVFKKALYLIKNSKTEEGRKILETLLENDSQLKKLVQEVLPK